ncbi:MAG: hypothetical protein JWL59_677 [Chthoniobacteraceae bacterium]|nr:hypothetical protein [Chthoniobacteraceae bacterium]
MKNRSACLAIPAWFCFGSLVFAQEKPPGGAAVEGVRGVKQEAVAKIRNVENQKTTVAGSSAQGVNKIDGIDTINGVKADGHTAVLSVPPPPVIPAGGITVPAGNAVGSAASIQAVHGVAGINAGKLQNLEAALLMKQGGGETPAGGGAEKGGKGKSAAAALLGGPPGKPAPKSGPKEDGREGFQEFEKLQNTGS